MITSQVPDPHNPSPSSQPFLPVNPAASSTV